MSKASRARQRGLFGKKLSRRFPHQHFVPVNIPTASGVPKRIWLKKLVSGFEPVNIRDMRAGEIVQFRGDVRQYVVRNNLHITHLKTKGVWRAHTTVTGKRLERVR